MKQAHFHILLFSIAICTLCIVSCETLEKVAPIPEINYKSYELSEGRDSLGNSVYVIQIAFSFIDGDGDIGIFPTNEPGLDSTNLYFATFEKTSLGEYIPLNNDQDTLSYSIKYDDAMERKGQNKTLKGVIYVDNIYYFLPDFDTIRYEFYMFDRARNISNIEVTEDIGLR